MPGPPIPNGCSRPAWTGVSTRTWPITSTTIPGRLSPIPRGACLGGDAPLRERALSTRTLQDLARDVAAGSLPQVSWIIAPAADSEHPEVSSPRAGAYTERVLDILTRNPAVWSRCVFFVTYDENDCFYDHVPPPARPRATTARNRAACPPWSWTANTTTRAPAPAPARPTTPPPCTAAPSAWGRACPCWWCRPWSQGGWVNAQVFDHTSVIRFLEARHGVMEPNISAWRRAVAGDLTSALTSAASATTRASRPAATPSRRAATAPCPMRWKPWAA